VIDEKPFPRLDVSRITFPSSQLTIGAMRRDQPDVFADSDRMLAGRLGEVNAFIMAGDELELAEKAYAEAMGQPDPYPDTDRLDLISNLDRDYQRLGISPGIANTRLLLREIENAAEKQANTHRGRMR
jgi:hypothetical protein